MIGRVPAFGAARIAFEATVSGLTVNGESLPAVPPNAEMSTTIKARVDDRERRRICAQDRGPDFQQIAPGCL